MGERHHLRTVGKGLEWEVNWTVWEAVNMVVSWVGLTGRSTTLWEEEKSSSGLDTSDMSGLYCAGVISCQYPLSGSGTTRWV